MESRSQPRASVQSAPTSHGVLLGLAGAVLALEKNASSSWASAASYKAAKMSHSGETSCFCESWTCAVGTHSFSPV